MTSNAIRRATITVLWLLALWNSWESRALFSDGAMFLIDVVQRGGFHSYNALARQYAIGATQIPLVAGLWLGVTDLQWLAQLFSLGTFAVPTALYHLALVRVKDDALLLAAVLAAIAIVFLTTSFFIVGEYNTGYALAITAAVFLATSDKPRTGDALVLLALAAIALRTYEVFLYLGPLLAAMIVWRTLHWTPRPDVINGESLVGRLLLMAVPTLAAGLAFLGLYPALAALVVVALATILVVRRRPGWEPALAHGLYYLAAGVFLASAIVAVDSVVRNGGARMLTWVASSGLSFWQNVPFDLQLGAVAILGFGALARPDSLARMKLYTWAALPLVVLALSPLLVWTDVLARPFGSLHYATRTVCGPVVAVLVGLVWLHAVAANGEYRLFAGLRLSGASRRIAKFSFLMVLASLPAQVLMTADWKAVLSSLQATITTRTGVLVLADLPAPVTRLYWMDDEVPLLSDLSVVLRSRPGDAAIAVYDYRMPLLDQPVRDLGGYFWGDAGLKVRQR